MKKLPLIGLPLVLAVLLVSCGHTHQWTAATCTTPKICEECGETEGEPLGHRWEAATCTFPQTCSVCGETQGKVLGHRWVAVTCTTPRTCSRCGETAGGPIPHPVAEWTVVQEPTCTQEGLQTGVCTACGADVSKPVEKLKHTPGDWETVSEPTKDADGVMILHCAVCDGEIKTETYSMTPEEIKDDYIVQCIPYTYEMIARDPDAYEGTYGTYTGEVIQVMEGDGGNCQLLVNITPDYVGLTRTYYKDTVYVLYTREEGESRLLDDDIVTIYGTNEGLYSYETVKGTINTVPLIYAEYIDLQ